MTMSLSSTVPDLQRRQHPPVLRALDRLDRVAEMELDAHLLELGLRELHDAPVVAREHLLHQLDDGHLAAERGVCARELQADDAAADDDDLARNLL